MYNIKFRYDPKQPKFLYNIKFYSDSNTTCLNNENIKGGTNNSTLDGLGVTCSGDYNNYIDITNKCTNSNSFVTFDSGTGINKCLGKSNYTIV